MALLSGQAPRAAADPASLEQELEANPADAGLRARLIRIYSQPARSVAPEVRTARGRHIVWMIQHDPANPVLSEGASTIDKAGHALADPEAYAAADRAWRQQVARPGAPAPVLANAVQFYRSPDPEFARKLAADGLKRFPGDSRLGTLAGVMDVLTILGGVALDSSGTSISYDDQRARSPEAAEARRTLEESSNPSRLGAAAWFLAQQAPSVRARGRSEQLKDVFDFAARCYERAISLDPDNAAWKSGLRSVYRTAAAQQPRAPDRYVYLERALRVPASEQENLALLPEVAQARFDAGDIAKAAEAAEEALRLSEAGRGWSAGQAIHTGNILLGRIALRRGQLDEAKSRLLKAGGTPGSQQLANAGPDWNLARELLAKGERETVLAYIELCRNFWRRDDGRLDSFAATIRAGGTPAFTPPPRRTASPSR